MINCIDLMHKLCLAVHDAALNCVSPTERAVTQFDCVMMHCSATVRCTVKRRDRGEGV